MLPGGVVQCDTCLSATKAFFFFIISKHHNQSKKQILLFTLAQSKHRKPQYITAQEKYTVGYQRQHNVRIRGRGERGDNQKVQSEVLWGGRGSDRCLQHTPVNRAHQQGSPCVHRSESLYFIQYRPWQQGHPTLTPGQTKGTVNQKPSSVIHHHIT